jgi:hypothetical protein
LLDEYNIDWVELLSRQCPVDEFHNYATPAHGPLYYDYVLKHIIANLPSNYYDTVIIQYTVLGRWFFPIKSLDNNNNAYPIAEFESTHITNNYQVMRLERNRMMATSGGAHIYNVVNPTRDIEKQCQALENAYHINHDPDTLASSYEKNFTKCFNTLYSKLFKNVFCWDFACNHGYGQFGADDDHFYRNTIGHNLPYQSWAIEKYGLEYFVANMLDNTMHCNRYGNEILANEYLTQSLIGHHLGLTHN